MKKSKIISLGVGGLVVLSSTVFAMTYNTFTATERPDFKIVMDGEVQKFKDGNGNEINPMIIKGSTYLPLKATANLFGKNVSWDAETGTATIGDKVATEYSLFDVSTITSTSSYANAVKGEQNLTFDIGDVGVSYKSAVKITNAASKFRTKLNDNYDKFNVTLLSPDGDATLTVKDADTGIDIVNRELKENEICELKDIDIRNVKNLEFEYDNYRGTAYFLNPTVK